MAENPVKTQDANPLEREAIARLLAARTQKSYREQEIKECYFFASPMRQRTINSMSEPSRAPPLDAGELNTDKAFLLCGDFITEVVNGYMPEAQPWCELGPGMDLPEGAWAKVDDTAKKNTAKVFNAMKASNLYPEVTKSFNPDLAIGTAAMWIDRLHPSQPIRCVAVPFRELEINSGPHGDVDDRFAVRWTRNCYARELLGEEIWAKVDEKIKKHVADKGEVRCQIVWGFWRKWEDKSNECWQHVVLLDNNLVHDVEIKGEGCCPLIVMRFNPNADWVFGFGPLWQGLPSLRQIDEAELMLQENAELALRPPTTFPNDSFTMVEQGLEAGMSYPIQPGTENAIKNIYAPPPANPEYYAYEQRMKDLRKLFFVDLPEQSGDTPPTATQWVDELARAQRRIGTPGLPFWREGPASIFTRFKYLLEKAGTIAPIQVNGVTVATLPRNPAQAAAELQEVAMFGKAVSLLGGTFPEEFKANADGRATMEAVLKKMRVTLLVLRDKGEVAKAVDQIAKLTMGRHAPEAPDATPGPAA